MAGGEPFFWTPLRQARYLDLAVNRLSHDMGICLFRVLRGCHGLFSVGPVSSEGGSRDRRSTGPLWRYLDLIKEF